MNIRKIKEIVKFEIEKSIQNKWFVILNIIFLISMIIITNKSNIENLMEKNNIEIFDSPIYTLQVLDNDNIFYDDFVEKNQDNEYVIVEKIESNEYSEDNIPEENTILIEINKDDEKIITAKLVTKEGIDDDTYNLISDSLKECRSKVFASKNNIMEDSLNVLNEDVSIDRVKLGINDDDAEVKQTIQGLSIFVIYLVVIFVISKMANSIVSEKVSKSTEYVLTSVTAKEYLLAKIISSTATVAITLLYGIVYFLIGSAINVLISGISVETGNILEVIDINMDIFGYALVTIGCLIFNLFVIALIQATMSAKATNVDEAGNTTLILLMIIIAAFYISEIVITPYEVVPMWIYILSVFPIFSMFFIPSMMVINQATIFQIVVSFLILILIAIFGLDICSKKFKEGILDYTSKKNIKKKKELDTIEKQKIELKMKSAKRFAFTIGLGTLLLITLENIIGIISMLVLSASKLSQSLVAIISNSITLIVALGLSTLFIMGYSKDYKEKKEKIVSFKFKIENIFSGITLIALIQVICIFISKKIGLDYDITAFLEINNTSSWFEYLIYILGIAFVPAIFEELLFRKAILNASKRFGNLFAVVFSALLFGLYHMNLLQCIFAFFIGIIFGIIALNTDSIKCTIILHFINNMYACLMDIFVEDSIGYLITNIIIVICIIIGFIILIKNISKLKNVDKEKFKLNDDFKYLFTDYTFIISMILIFVMFIETENVLRVL